MFVGRKEQLEIFEKMYQSDFFEFIVLYGQRRVGKTTLLGEFIKGKEAIFFTAKEANDAMNLQEFTELISNYFGLNSRPTFASWQHAFEFISELANDEKITIIFDEYPYAAMANKSLNSMLQIAIDHQLKNTKIKLILSGSHVSFMEKEVMGSKSPLYGRRTKALQLKPFDYFETGLMLQEYSNVDKIKFYSILGGIPYYLSLVDKSLTFEENMIDMFFKVDGKLYDEPNFLMKEEFREPAVYNSVIMAVAKGANRPNEIQQMIQIDAQSSPFYLKQLTDIGFLRKQIPFGENPLKSKKGIYEIADNTFRFWYEYVYPHTTSIELGFGEAIAKTKVLPFLDEFIGKSVFEFIAQQYLVRAVKHGKLLFIPTNVGKWWGNDPKEKKETDIDVIFESENEVILGECKWRESFSEIIEARKLIDKARLLPGYNQYHFYFFTKHPVKLEIFQTLEAENLPEINVVPLDDMFNF